MKVEFDAAKDDANRAKHGVSLQMAADFDWSAVIAKPDARKEYGEDREIGYGPIGERLYCVVYTRRAANVLRIISLRKANNREVTRYENATKAD